MPIWLMVIIISTKNNEENDRSQNQKSILSQKTLVSLAGCSPNWEELALALDVAFDVEGAFDSMEEVIHKFGAELTTCNWIATMLRTRTVVAKLHEVEVKVGVSKG